MRTLSLLAAASVAAPVLAAQTPATHLINAPSATSAPVLGLAAAVRELPGGRVLVNDILKRQLLMFDATLQHAAVVADSTSGGASSYGPGPGGIIPYVGDSTLFIDPRDLSMFVIDPNGAIARVAAVPRSQDAGSLGSNMGASPAFDSKGRIVYRAGAGIRIGGAATAMRTMVAGGDGGGRGMPAMPDIPDSMAIVRVDVATRKVDTAGYYKIPKTKMNVVQSDRGVTMMSETNPLPTVDDWAVTSDGIIAVVRGQDYHIDWIDADGHVTSSAKIPFDWQRLSDDDKVAVIDSAKAAAEQLSARLAANPGGAQVVQNGAGGGGGVRIMTFNMGGDAAGAGKGGAPAGLGLGTPVFVSPSELPDYRPAFGPGAVKADLDGNLWIRTSSVRAGVVGGPIYDVVNGKGELVDRVQLQAGRQIVGFGRNGVVYLQARDEKGAWLEKTKRDGPRT